MTMGMMAIGMMLMMMIITMSRFNTSTLLGSDFAVERDEDDVRSILEVACRATSGAAVAQSGVDDADDLPHDVTAEDRVGHAQRAVRTLIPRHELLPQPLQHRDLIHFLSSYIRIYPHTRID
jgi:hypothetical protein